MVPGVGKGALFREVSSIQDSNNNVMGLFVKCFTHLAEEWSIIELYTQYVCMSVSLDHSTSAALKAVLFDSPLDGVLFAALPLSHCDACTHTLFFPSSLAHSVKRLV